MVALRVHKDFQQVRYLPFCYLCGREFVKEDRVDGDHVPPKAAFNARDKEPALKLKTHVACNSSLKVDDKKIGQLVGLRRGQRPSSPRDQALQIVHYTNLDMMALENLDVDAAVWRWVKGFHAALYRKPLTGKAYAVQTPFPRGETRAGRVSVEPIRKQHLLAVEAIKRNRVAGSLDIIVANKGNLRYECVWCKEDTRDVWLCMFAADIYEWKDLGSHTSKIPARGCAGIYMLPHGSIPETASRDTGTRIEIPNRDVLDAFAP
jgi:hypothetical protein